MSRIPRGKGVYVRDGLAADPAAMVAWAKAAGMKWLAVNFVHPTAIRAAVAAGFQTWVFIDIDRSEVSAWRASVIAAVAAARAYGAVGIIIDPERTWAGASVAERNALAATLADVLRSGLGVGVTTHTGLTAFAAALARVLGPLGGWGSPQVYDHQLGETLDRPAHVVAQWSTQPWPIIPSVGSFGGDDASFREYFARLPHVRAAVLWYADLPQGSRLAVLRDVWQVARSTWAWLVGGGIAVAVGYLLYRNRKHLASVRLSG